MTTGMKVSFALSDAVKPPRPKRFESEIKEYMALIFVDTEADGPCPGKGVMTEFGAVELELPR